MTYTAQKMMDDNADKVPDDLKTEIAEKIAAVRTALEGEDTEQIASASGELQESMQKVGQIVYSQAGGGEGGAPPPPGDGMGGDGEGPPEGTVEGEFREV
jgi:molecular chaperone DnaK